nr:formylglycine-generating enzyme family protein [Deltaproteobacteria bacterium]
RDADERAYQAVLSAYWIGTTEVTQAQWRAVMGDAPSECSVGCGDDYPVNKITWEDAARFANTLSRKLGFSECYQHVYSEWVWDRSCDGFRFPTEAEWETAARAGTTTPYSFGDRSVVCVHANLNEDTEPDCSDGYEGLAPVQTYGPNAWGVYGMHGNAREWIWDFDGDYPTGVVHDPAGPTSGNYRGLRGGSFENSPEFLRSAFRDSISPTIGTESIGFRVARSGRSR